MMARNKYVQNIGKEIRGKRRDTWKEGGNEGIIRRFWRCELYKSGPVHWYQDFGSYYGSYEVDRVVTLERVEHLQTFTNTFHGITTAWHSTVILWRFINWVCNGDIKIKGDASANSVALIWTTTTVLGLVISFIWQSSQQGRHQGTTRRILMFRSVMRFRATHGRTWTNLNPGQVYEKWNTPRLLPFLLFEITTRAHNLIIILPTNNNPDDHDSRNKSAHCCRRHMLSSSLGPSSIAASALKMETAYFFDTLVSIYELGKCSLRNLSDNSLSFLT